MNLDSKAGGGGGASDGKDELLSLSDPRRTRLRNIGGMHQDKFSNQIVSNSFTSAGLPSKNFGKPFSYMEACYPGGSAAPQVNKNES